MEQDNNKPDSYGEWVRELGKEGVGVSQLHNKDFNPAMTHQMKFPCTACGSCCKRVKQAVEHMKLHIGHLEDPQYKEVWDFPHKWDETGRCEKLGADNKCTVYENRPPLCNIAEVHKRVFSHLSKEEFFRYNINGCNYMMDQDKVPLDKRIPIIQLNGEKDSGS